MAETYFKQYSISMLMQLIRAGEFAVPNFQREFVWSTKHVLELFDTINRGLPIGTLTALESDGRWFPQLETARSGLPQATIGVDAGYVLWILDGVQRMSALYSCLMAHSSARRILYDLRLRTFSKATSRSEQIERIPLSTLFDSRELMPLQLALHAAPEGEELLTELNAFRHRVFNYPIPMVVIRDVDKADLVQVFIRLNSGVGLSKSHVAKALSASDDKGEDQ